MVRGMPFCDRDENTATSSANFSIDTQSPFNCRAIVAYLDHFRRQEHGTAGRRWPKQFNPVLGGNRAGRMIFTGMLHQMIRRSPVAMAIQQRADDAAVQYSIKRFVFLLGLPFGDNFAACSRFIGVLWKTSDVQTIRVSRPTTPAGIVRCVLFLQGLFAHALKRCEDSPHSKSTSCEIRSGWLAFCEAFGVRRVFASLLMERTVRNLEFIRCSAALGTGAIEGRRKATVAGSADCDHAAR